MSTVVAIESAALGVDGATFWVEAGATYPDDHPAVTAHPDKFSRADAEAPRQRGRGGRG